MRFNIRATGLHAAVVGLANSVLQTVAAFGAHLNADQNAAITGVVNALLVTVSVVLIQATNGYAHRHNGETDG